MSDVLGNILVHQYSTSAVLHCMQITWSSRTAPMPALGPAMLQQDAASMAMQTTVALKSYTLPRLSPPLLLYDAGQLKPSDNNTAVEVL